MCVQSQLANWIEIVQRFNPELLYLITGHDYFARRDLARSTVNADEPIPAESTDSAVALYQEVREECVRLDLRASSISAERVISAFKERKTRLEIVGVLEELSHRVADELACRFFLQLSIAESDRYEKWGDGWEEIVGEFPDTTRDVEEMNKCFALGRYTASMFHALHVAEWGAIRLGDLIGVEDAKRGWGATKRKLKEIMDGGHAKLPPTLSGKYDFLEQMNREIESMSLAWRHKVDHAANHLHIVPNTDFTPDIAQHVIGAVRIFMIRLSEGIAPEAI